MNRYEKKMKGMLREWFQHEPANIVPENKVSISWPVYDVEEVWNALQSLVALRISQGSAVKEFEQRFARYIGAAHAVAVNSGSSANLLALAALREVNKLKPGDEVIVPAATFSAVAAPVLHMGLIPVYVDVDKNSWNISPIEINKAITKKTRAIMVVHSFGNPADMPAIMRIARKYRLSVIEDCCEAHGATIGKRKVGSFGDLATMSFYVAHNITTGEGGMIFTSNDRLQDILRSLREFGRLPAETIRNKRFSFNDTVLKNYDARYITARLGFNVRMTDIAASLGIAQLNKLDKLNRRRFAIVKEYQKFLSAYTVYLQLPYFRPNTVHSFYGYPMLVKKNNKFNRENLVSFLEKNGIETRPFFDGCLPDQPAFRNQPGRSVGGLPIARTIRDSAFFIGCHAGLTPRHVRQVRDTIQAFLA